MLMQGDQDDPRRDAARESRRPSTSRGPKQLRHDPKDVLFWGPTGEARCGACRRPVTLAAAGLACRCGP